MSCRMVILAPRKEGLSHAEYLDYMEETHLPIVRDLPGLEDCTVSIPLDPDGAGYDAMAELRFDTPATLGDAFESEAGRRVIADVENFVDTDAAVMVAVGAEDEW